jgi:hypothetical protein
VLERGREKSPQFDVASETDSGEYESVRPGLKMP